MAQGRIWILGGGALAIAAVVVAWLALRFDATVPGLAEGDRLTAALPIDPAVPTAAVPTAPVPTDPDPSDPDPTDPVAAPALPEPPGFDVVRVATDGGALVAGRAAPGAAVELRIDGLLVAQAMADAAGQFVAIFALEPSDQTQILALAMVLGSGTVVPSDDVVVLAPRAERLPALAADPSLAGSAPGPVAAASPDAPADEPVASPDPGDQIAGLVPAPADPDTLPEAAPPPIFLLDREGRVRVLDAAPQALDNVVIDTIGYDAQGGVQLSGRARQGGDGTALRIYLDNRPLAVARSAAGQWGLDLPDVAPGVYTLRVDELDIAGQVVSRFETPFLREDPVTVSRLLAGSQGAEPVAPAVGGAVAGAVTDAPGPDPDRRADTLAGLAPEGGTTPPTTAPTPVLALPEAVASAGPQAQDPASVPGQTQPMGDVAALAPPPGSAGPDPATLAEALAPAAQSTEPALPATGPALTNGAPDAAPAAAVSQPPQQAAAGSPAEAAEPAITDPEPVPPPVPPSAPPSATSAGAATVDTAAAPTATPDHPVPEAPATAAPTPDAAALAETVPPTDSRPSGATTPDTTAAEALTQPPIAGPATGAAGLAEAATAVPAPGSPTSDQPESMPAAAVQPAPPDQPLTGSPSAPPPARVTLITVQPGQSLWRISEDQYGDGGRYVQIFRANRAQIRNPNLIYPGQVFSLPD